MVALIGIIAIVAPGHMTGEAGNTPAAFFGGLFAIMGGVAIILGWALAIGLVCAGTFCSPKP